MGKIYSENKGGCIMNKFNRIFLIVMDSVGIGEAPDADKFNDKGADTLGHIAEHMNGLDMPHLGSLGLSNIRKIRGIKQAATPQAHFTKMQEASNGKDTMTGHWEMMGLNNQQPIRDRKSELQGKKIEH